MIFDINRQLNWYNHPFDICCHLLVMCKEGWCVGLGKEGVVWGWEELSKIPWEWDRKQWRRNRDFKKAGQAWSSSGCLKEGGAGTLPKTMLHLNRLHKFYMLLYVAHMLHDSAAFKWGDIQSFLEGGRTFSILWEDLITP